MGLIISARSFAIFRANVSYGGGEIGVTGSTLRRPTLLSQENYLSTGIVLQQTTTISTHPQNAVYVRNIIAAAFSKKNSSGTLRKPSG